MLEQMTISANPAPQKYCWQGCGLYHGASVALSAGGTAKHSSFTLTWGNLCLDINSGRVTFSEQVISLTAIEYNLLELLRRNPDRIFSLRAILDRLWGMDGLAVYGRLQSDPITRSSPIILLTAKVLPIGLNLLKWR